MMKHLLLASMWSWLMLSVVLPSSAQEITWEQLNGPSGGQTNNFQAGPGGLVFASFEEMQDSSTVNVIYRSTDYGDNWERTSFDGENAYIIGVSSLGHAFVSSEDGYYRSSDNGDTWTQVFMPSDARVNTILEGDSNKLYLAGEDLFFSEDNGQTWVLSDTADSFLIDVNSEGNLLRVTNNQLQMSTNDGFEWTVLNELDFPIAIEVFVVNDNDEMLVGGNWLFKISADGSTYEQVSQDLNFEQLVVSPSGTIIGRVYLASAIISLDDGETWENIGERIPGHFENSFAVSPDSVMYVSTVEGLFRSDDDGITWVEAHGGVFHANLLDLDSDDEGNIYVITETRLLKKESQGDEWETVFNADVDEYFSDLRVRPEGDVYVITRTQRFDKSTLDSCNFENCDRLFHSSDGGESWQRIFNSAFLSDIEINNNGEIFISTSFGLRTSADNGQSWEEIPDDDYLFYDITLGPDGELMYAENWDGYFRLNTVVEAWEPIYLPGALSSDLLVNSNGDLYIISRQVVNNQLGDYSIQKSTDMGFTWDDISPAQGLTITELYVGMYDILYLFSTDGMYRSLDHGSTWQDMGGEIVVIDVTSDGEGTLYASATEGGVWRSTSFVPVNNIPLTQERLHVYPNPSSGTIQVDYRSSNDDSPLRIYNNKGQLVKEVPVTSPNATINISTLSPGLYLLKKGKENGRVVIY